MREYGARSPMSTTSKSETDQGGGWSHDASDPSHSSLYASPDDTVTPIRRQLERVRCPVVVAVTWVPSARLRRWWGLGVPRLAAHRVAADRALRERWSRRKDTRRTSGGHDRPAQRRETVDVTNGGRWSHVGPDAGGGHLSHSRPIGGNSSRIASMSPLYATMIRCSCFGNLRNWSVFFACASRVNAPST